MIEIMKKFTGNILYVAAAAFALTAVSCSRSNDDDYNYTLEANSAVVYYATTGSDAKYDIAQLSLVCGDLIENNGSYSGQGTALLLDMNITKGAKYILAGTYNCYDGVEDFEFIPGMYNGTDRQYFPTYVYERNSDMRVGEYYLVKSGKVFIKRDGANYTVDANVGTNNGQYHFTYYGKFTEGDTGSGDNPGGGEDNPGGGDNPGGDNPGGGGDNPGGDESDPTVGQFPDASLAGFKYGLAGYCGGELWLDANGNVINPNTYSDWVIILTRNADDFDDITATMIQLEIIAAPGSNDNFELGTKKYTVVDVVTSETCVPYKAVSGYVDDEGYYTSCYYFDEDNGRYYRITGGTVTISNSMNISYDVTLDLLADDNGAKVTGTFKSVNFTFKDYTVAEPQSRLGYGHVPDQTGVGNQSVNVVRTMRRLAARMPYSRRAVPASLSKTVSSDRGEAAADVATAGTSRTFAPRSSK